MKKALVLGVMAMFAINFIAVQNVNAQGPDKSAAKPTKTSVSAQPNTAKTDGKQVDPKRADRTSVNSQSADDKTPTTTKKASGKLTTTIKEGNAGVQSSQAAGSVDGKPVKFESDKTTTNTKTASGKLTTTIKEGNAGVQSSQAAGSVDGKPVKIESDKTTTVKHNTTLGTHKSNGKADKAPARTKITSGKTTLKTNPNTNSLKLRPKEMIEEKTDAAKAEKAAAESNRK